MLLATLLSPVAALADQSISDQYTDSILYAKPVEFIPNVWMATGATAPATYANSGHNNNYTFVITDDGVVVINSGSYLLAQALHEEIQRNWPVEMPAGCLNRWNSNSGYGRR